MDFIIFNDIEGKAISNSIYWKRDNKTIKALPEDARGFTYFHQSDPEKIYNVEYRLGAVLPNELGFALISSSEERKEMGISFKESYDSVMSQDKKAKFFPLTDDISVYVENGVPHFNFINDNTILVENKKELLICLNNELNKIEVKTRHN